MQKPFWFYDPNEGQPEFFAIESDRDAYAALAMAAYQKEAHDNEEWSDDAFQVVCGVVTHTAQITNKQIIARPPTDEIDEDGYDEEGNQWHEEDEIITYDVAMLPAPRGQEGTP